MLSFFNFKPYKNIVCGQLAFLRFYFYHCIIVPYVKITQLTLNENLCFSGFYYNEQCCLEYSCVNGCIGVSQEYVIKSGIAECYNILYILTLLDNTKLFSTVAVPVYTPSVYIKYPSTMQLNLEANFAPAVVTPLQWMDPHKPQHHWYSAHCPGFSFVLTPAQLLAALLSSSAVEYVLYRILLGLRSFPSRLESNL